MHGHARSSSPQGKAFQYLALKFHTNLTTSSQWLLAPWHTSPSTTMLVTLDRSAAETALSPIGKFGASPTCGAYSPFIDMTQPPKLLHLCLKRSLRHEEWEHAPQLTVGWLRRLQSRWRLHSPARGWHISDQLCDQARVRSIWSASSSLRCVILPQSTNQTNFIPHPSHVLIKIPKWLLAPGTQDSYNLTGWSDSDWLKYSWAEFHLRTSGTAVLAIQLSYLNYALTCGLIWKQLATLAITISRQWVLVTVSWEALTYKARMASHSSPPKPQRGIPYYFVIEICLQLCLCPVSKLTDFILFYS